VFGPKDHVYTAKDFGITGKEDPKAIDAAVQKKCSIVTVNKDFLDYYRDHPMRKGKWGKYGYGLIFPSFHAQTHIDRHEYTRNVERIE
jgi:hypothetical protein